MNSEKLQESEKLIAIGEQRLTAIRDQGQRTTQIAIGEQGGMLTWRRVPRRSKNFFVGSTCLYCKAERTSQSLPVDHTGRNFKHTQRVFILGAVLIYEAGPCN
jgi:hypothetical protein